MRILHAVLEAGSFSQAARQLGSSQPTVSRQIKALERELGATLVVSSTDGITPTEAALALLPELQAMARTAQRISSATTESQLPPSVRIACGPWVGLLICRHAPDLSGDPLDTHLDIATDILFADMPRREADIAIRTRRPERAGVRMRKLPHFHYAVYGARTLVDGDPRAFDKRRFSAFDWAMLSKEQDHFPTSRWLRDRHVENVIVRCSQSTNLLQAVKSGSMLAVLPCFVGDADLTLRRVSDSFVPESGAIWLVLPDDVQQKPAIRRVADRLIALFQSRFSADAESQRP